MQFRMTPQASKGSQHAQQGSSRHTLQASPVLHHIAQLYAICACLNVRTPDKRAWILKGQQPIGHCHVNESCMHSYSRE